MTNPQELLTPNLREIVYYGQDVAQLLQTNIKLTTLRRPAPKYEGFKVGQLITGKCEAEVVPLIVWGVLEKTPLNHIDPILLALDGYTDSDPVHQAARDLKQYPGYEDIAPDTPMNLIATLYQTTFEALTPQQQSTLLSYPDRSLPDIARHQLLRPLFQDATVAWLSFRLEALFESS